jgi:serine/threonine protein kinase
MTECIGKQIGNYRVLRRLGSGGFAEVYLGEHVYLHTQAAIKMLNTRLTEDGLTSFQQEAQTIASLDHPHIVRVLDFGIQDQMPFLVMAHASGGTLRQRHPAGTRLTLLPIVDYVTQIANALQYAHDRKIIHRDIKPENVLMRADGTLLLSDFGIAVLSQSSRYQGKQEVSGTVAYMAPEQAQGHAVIASDQYALGIVVYEWLAGSLPFTGSFLEVCSQHLLTPPPSLRKLVPGLSPAVEDAVFLALSKDPHQRFQTVKAFANALANALDDTHTFRKTKQATNERPLDQKNVSTFVKTPSFTNPAWAPPPDQMNGSTFVTPPLPTSPAWTPPPGWEAAPTVGTYPPPKPPVPRPKRASGFVMASITLGILLVVASIAGVAYLLGHNTPSGTPGGTGSPTTQATLTSTSGSTNGLSYPHLSSSYSGTAYDTTYQKSANLSFSISQNQQAISGTAKVSANGLMDSGNVTGTVGTDETLQFTVTFASGGVSKFVGTISSQKTLSGTYTTTYPNGISPNHQGTWEVSPNSV